MIDPMFRNINRLFVPSFKNGYDDPIRNSFHVYYMPFVEAKGFIASFDNKSFFDQPVKSTQEGYEKPVEMSRNNDYTTGNLLDYSYHKNYYKHIGMVLSRQKKSTIPQQINFTKRLEENNVPEYFFITEKQ